MSFVEEPSVMRMRGLCRLSPLMIAASVGAEDIVQAILSAGGSHSHTDRWERTALHLAVSAGENGVASAQLLLHAGADPFVEDCKGVSAQLIHFYTKQLTNHTFCLDYYLNIFVEHLHTLLEL